MNSIKNKTTVSRLKQMSLHYCSWAQGISYTLWNLSNHNDRSTRLGVMYDDTFSHSDTKSDTNRQYHSSYDHISHAMCHIGANVCYAAAINTHICKRQIYRDT